MQRRDEVAEPRQRYARFAVECLDHPRHGVPAVGHGAVDDEEPIAGARERGLDECSEVLDGTEHVRDQYRGRALNVLSREGRPLPFHERVVVKAGRGEGGTRLPGHRRGWLDDGDVAQRARERHGVAPGARPHVD